LLSKLNVEQNMEGTEWGKYGGEPVKKPPLFFIFLLFRLNMKIVHGIMQSTIPLNLLLDYSRPWQRLPFWTSLSFSNPS